MKDPATKKYELVGPPNEYGLYRIRALRDIVKTIEKGDLGGLVEGEHNLSHEGDCWIDYGARVGGSDRMIT